MSWSFPNADTYAAFSDVGALPQNGAPISTWWMIRPSVASDFGVYLGLESGGDRLGILSVIGQYFTTADGSGGPVPVVNEWQVIGYDDNNAGGGTVRWHHCTGLTGTPTWAHSDGTSGGDRSGVVDALRLGIGPGGFRMRGHVAAGAITAGRLGDAGFEALGVTSMAAWVAAADLAWQCNVAVGATALTDLTGGSANQTSLTGTPSLDTGQEPPNWTYYTALVQGSGSAALGGLTGTGVGSRSKTGAATASLGALAGTAAGTRSKSGAGSVALGHLVAAGRGNGATGASRGWYGLISIYREAADELAEQRVQRPQACPSDGEPLTSGPDGTLFCKFDGFQWPRDRDLT